ncbi:MAG: ketoacyl-ACP synthase III [Dysgonamonadaceae bacterium]|jgi:3-oxoacyl-[acyl-carrier-protein] synthase-3|nr:ketoacyl-ACP synthase III [Dysgonamonadaceae bacterium]
MFISATGYYIPENRVHNDYFLAINGLKDEWIFQRTGISTRSKASDEDTMDVMCLKAVNDALPKLPYDIKEVDLIIFASYSPSDTVGTTAHVIQRQFGIEHAKAFLISSACSSAINAMEIIQSFFSSGLASKALLISADRNSTYSNETDPAAGHLWGDAAAALFFSKEPSRADDPEVVKILTQGLGHIGKGPAAVTLQPKDKGIQMPEGRDVFIHACNYIAWNTEKILEDSGYRLSDLSYFIGHQANMRILTHVIKELGLSEEKMLSNIRELGNTGSVSSVLVFAQNFDLFKPQDLVCLSVFGGGYSAGSCLIKF